MSAPTSHSPTTPEIRRTVAGSVGAALVLIGRDGRGVGFVVTSGADGRIVTNAHHLRDRTTQVTFPDGRTAQATVQGADADGDLVVLAVDAGPTPAVVWASDEPVLGDDVHAVSRDAQGVRVTSGSVSSTGRVFRGPRGRKIEAALEHTAALAGGSSGSPIVDAEGRVVGINTHRIGRGFYLALPASAELQRRVAALSAGEQIARPSLGLALAPAEAAARMRQAVGLPDRPGLLVRDVVEGGPADQGGVRRGDLIVAAAGGGATRDVVTADDLFAVIDAVSALPSGDAGRRITLSLVRISDDVTAEIVLA